MDRGCLPTLPHRKQTTTPLEKLLDMLLEIFARLPKDKPGIKTVLQCRKVCWRSLVEKPKIGMFFANRSTHWGRDIELFCREQSSFIKIGAVPFTIYFSLVGSCNGLVCYKAGHGRPIIYIFNPLTGERIRVPRMDPYVQSAGFGYCHSTGTYKVVNTRYIEDGRRCVQVYTLGDGSGCREKPEIAYKFKEACDPGVFANGALHWLDKNCDIVAFDLAEETFRSLSSPQCHLTSNSYINVTLEGDLCFYHTYEKQDEPLMHMMDIWVFKKKNLNNCQHSTNTEESTKFDSFTWIKVLSIKRDLCRKYHLLSLKESEILVWKSNDVLSCYDATTFERLWYVEGPGLDCNQGFPHMHSLVSLKDLGEELLDY